MSYHVARGGAWDGVPDDLRAAFRGSAPPSSRLDDVGFRPVMIDGDSPSEGEEMFGEMVLGFLEWVKVPAGSFLMGSPEGEGYDDEHPQHEVTFKKPFWIMKTPVTNEVYLRFCDATGTPYPSLAKATHFNDPRHPVVCVSWHDAQAFVAWFNETYAEELGPNREVRLPTEEEWEYAARGPENRRYPWGDNPPTPELACYWDSKRNGPAIVGSYPKGASWCGALDLAGNVWEWCEDIFDACAYALKLKARDE